MKTIFSNGTYQRVSDEMGRAKYAPKSEWKTKVRGVQKSAEVTEADAKGEVTKSKKAEKAAKLKAKQRA